MGSNLVWDGPIGALQPVEKEGDRDGNKVDEKSLAERKLASGEALEESEWRAIFASIIPRMKSTLRRRGCPPQHIDDLVQDACLLVWKVLEKQGLKRSLYGLAITVLCRRWLNFIRDSDPSMEELDTSLVARVSSPERSAAASELFKAFEEAVHDLPPRMRRAFALVKIQGWSYELAAKLMGITPGAIGALVWQARRRLSERLAGFRRLAEDRGDNGQDQPGEAGEASSDER